MRREATRGRPFEIVLVDTTMDGMDGLMLARAIKSDPRISQSRLIMLTTLDRRDDLEAFRECGVDDYVTKPIKRKQLLESLLNVIGSEEGPRAIMSGLMAMDMTPPPVEVAKLEPTLRIQ